MNIESSCGLMVLVVIFSAFLLWWPATGLTHCNTMDGPVVKAAQKALESGNVNAVPMWVEEKDETEVKTAFEKVLAVRKLGPEAKEVVDTHFFETLVRIHRAGE